MMDDGSVVKQMNIFEPGKSDGTIFRRALGRFGTGVTVVTAHSDFGPVGMTANSFSSVSMDPPLVLWSVSKASQRAQSFIESEHFAIHILTKEQEDLCGKFAKSADAFKEIDWMFNEQNVPVIKNCLAHFECRRYNNYEGGDHTIMVGEVLRASYQESDPLLFYGGALGSFNGA